MAKKIFFDFGEEPLVTGFLPKNYPQRGRGTLIVGIVIDFSGYRSVKAPVRSGNPNPYESLGAIP